MRDLAAELRKQADERSARVENAVINLNHEMSEVQTSLGNVKGQLVWIKFLMGGTFLATLGELAKMLLK